MTTERIGMESNWLHDLGGKMVEIGAGVVIGSLVTLLSRASKKEVGELTRRVAHLENLQADHRTEFARLNARMDGIGANVERILRLLEREHDKS